MPKYYCRSGDFRLLCDAPDPVAAGTRLVAQAMEAMDAGGAGGLGFLVAVSERGHDDPQAGMLPAIPLARNAGWEAAIKPELRRTLRAMPPGGRDWLLGRVGE
jgi:hypothetical protein